MSLLSESIRRCNTRVVSVGEIASLSRGKVLSKDYLREHVGEYPVYSSQTANNGEFGRIDTYDYDGTFLTWTTDGAYAGTIFIRQGRFSITNVCGLIKVTDSNVDLRYLYYWLSIHAKEYVSEGMGNPKLMSNVMEKVRVELPPLSVQQEIVRILDSFTDLQDNLQQELEARKKQYEVYREKLLSFNEIGGGIEWKMIGEIGILTRGSGLQKKDFSEEGVGCIHYGQIYTRLGSYTYSTLSFVPSELAEKLTPVQSGDLVIACTSENVEDVCKSVVWLGKENIVTGGHAAVLHHNESPKYIGYCFQTNNFFNQKRMYAYGAKVIDIKTEKLAQIKLPIPPRKKQDEIVEILDSFECTLDNIKKEMSARQTQYEYYREQLLSF